MVENDGEKRAAAIRDYYFDIYPRPHYGTKADGS